MVGATSNGWFKQAQFPRPQNALVGAEELS
jgi:hypothetical protein